MCCGMGPMARMPHRRVLSYHGSCAVTYWTKDSRNGVSVSIVTSRPFQSNDLMRSIVPVTETDRNR